MAPFAIDDILSENPIHFQDQKFCQLGVETQTDIDVLPHCFKILTRYSTAHRCPNSHHGLGGICLNICVRFGQGTSEGFQISSSVPYYFGRRREDVMELMLWTRSSPQSSPNTVFAAL